MKKRIIDLTDKDIKRFMKKECPKYISHECYNCPLDIYADCYVDIKEKLEEIIEVEDE